MEQREKELTEGEGIVPYSFFFIIFSILENFIHVCNGR